MQQLPHLTAEETAARKGEVPPRGHMPCVWQSWEQARVCPIPEAMHLNIAPPCLLLLFLSGDSCYLHPHKEKPQLELIS